MLTQLRSMPLRVVAPASTKGMDREHVGGALAGRLLQVALAVYLLPALLIVLAVGGVGMLILAASRILRTPISRPVC